LPPPSRHPSLTSSSRARPPSSPAQGVKLELIEFKPPAMRDDEVFVDVHFCGMCHSDIHSEYGLRAPAQPRAFAPPRLCAPPRAFAQPRSCALPARSSAALSPRVASLTPAARPPARSLAPLQRSTTSGA